jgi:hypothetical protein
MTAGQEDSCKGFVDYHTEPRLRLA